MIFDVTQHMVMFGGIFYWEVSSAAARFCRNSARVLALAVLLPHTKLPSDNHNLLWMFFLFPAQTTGFSLCYTDMQYLYPVSFEKYGAIIVNILT